ncbi:Uncharacterized protein Rs2_35791 [Raphanus sativus]|nr:Uncharacterized protein Rs2_35791 [Raphanus sativus]
MIRPFLQGPVSLQYITIYGLQGRAILGLICTSRDTNINHKVIICTCYLRLDLTRSCASCIMSGHAPPLQTSIMPYHILPVLIRTNHGSHPSSLSWDFHETSFCTASTFKAVQAFGSGVWPSQFSSGHLGVSLRHRGSLGCVHP